MIQCAVETMKFIIGHSVYTKRGNKYKAIIMLKDTLTRRLPVCAGTRLREECKKKAKTGTC